MQNPNPPAQAAPSDKGAAQVPPVPFVRGSLERVQRARQWTQTVTLSTDVQPLPTLSVPSHGFARSVIITAEIDQMTGGTYSADGLAAALRSVNFADTGGSDVIVPLGGHDLAMVNKWVPSGGVSNPTVLFPNTLKRFWRLPLEISGRDGLGSLPNMDASSLYTVETSVAPLADIFDPGDLPTTPPDLTLSAYLEAWSPPQPADFGGRPVAPQPPALNTTQYVSKQRVNFPAAGDQSVKLERRGNLIRAILLVGRTEAGVRSDSVLPTSFRFRWDGREMYDIDTEMQRYFMRERSGMTVDTGVLLLDFSHEFDGTIGSELRDQWLRTLKSSDLEIDCNGVAAAGQLSIITVDVAPSGNVYVD